MTLSFLQVVWIPAPWLHTAMKYKATKTFILQQNRCGERTAIRAREQDCVGSTNRVLGSAFPRRVRNGFWGHL